MWVCGGWGGLFVGKLESKPLKEDQFGCGSGFFGSPLLNLIYTYFFIHYPKRYLVLHPEHNKKGLCNLHPYARWQPSNSSHCHPLGRTPAFHASGLNLQTSWSETKLIWFLYGSWMPLAKFHNYFFISHLFKETHRNLCVMIPLLALKYHRTPTVWGFGLHFLVYILLLYNY